MSAPTIAELDALDPSACAEALAPLFEGAPRFLARLAAARPYREEARLFALAREHRLEIISIEQLIRHRRQREKLVHRIAEADLPLTRAWRNRDEIRRWFRTSDPIGEAQHAAFLCGAPYAVPAFKARVRGVYQNKPPSGPYRGVGQPIADIRIA